MEYSVISVDREGKITTLVECMSQTDYDKIKASIARLQKGMLCKDYIAIVCENIRELKEYFAKLEPNNKKQFQTLNRYTYNVLGAYYAWMEFWESNFKAAFAPVKKKYYDKYFEYRMMYNLRTFMTHCEMGVTRMQLDIINNELSIYIEPDRLLAHPDRLQKIFIPELETMAKSGKCIELDTLINGFEDLYIKMNRELLDAITPELQDILNSLTPYISFNGGIADSSYIREKETGKHALGLTSFLGLFIEKMAIAGINS